MYAGGAYRPGPSPARFTAFFLIAAAHLCVVAAVALLGGTRAVIETAKPLVVHFVSPLARPVEVPTARVPLPVLRAPEIHVPLPAIETIAVHHEERPAPPAPIPAQPMLVAEAPKAAPAAAAEPPRFDLAYLDNPAPVYPPLSKRLREQGRVMLRVLVNAMGLVEDIQVVATSGHERLDESALAAVRRWKFVPARSGEKPVPGWALVPIAFNLQG